MVSPGAPPPTLCPWAHLSPAWGHICFLSLAVGLRVSSCVSDLFSWIGPMLVLQQSLQPCLLLLQTPIHGWLLGQVHRFALLGPIDGPCYQYLPLPVVLQDCALVQALPGLVLPLVLGSPSLRNSLSSLLADMDYQLRLVWRQQTGECVWPCIPQYCACLLLSVSEVYCFSGMDLLIQLNLANDFCHCSTKPLVHEKCIKRCFGEFPSWHPKSVCQLC